MKTQAAPTETSATPEITKESLAQSKKDFIVISREIGDLYRDYQTKTDESSRAFVERKKTAMDDLHIAHLGDFGPDMQQNANILDSVHTTLTAYRSRTHSDQEASATRVAAVDSALTFVDHLQGGIKSGILKSIDDIHAQYANPAPYEVSKQDKLRFFYSAIKEVVRDMDARDEKDPLGHKNEEYVEFLRGFLSDDPIKNEDFSIPTILGTIAFLDTFTPSSGKKDPLKYNTAKAALNEFLNIAEKYEQKLRSEETQEKVEEAVVEPVLQAPANPGIDIEMEEDEGENSLTPTTSKAKVNRGSDKPLLDDFTPKVRVGRTSDGPKRKSRQPDPYSLATEDF